jgi:hypothetical protein
MSAIVLLDTSVYLNVLDVPGFNQERTNVLNEFERAVRARDRFLLPLASVWETGKHIAQLSDGRQRRQWAEKLTADVLSAFEGDTPYSATHFAKREDFEGWLTSFPDAAAEGKSLADHSLVQEWRRNCDLNPLRRVRIWSLDSDLAGYDRKP